MQPNSNTVLAVRLWQVAQDRRLASLVAAGLEMALDDDRLTARFNLDAVAAASRLQSALEDYGAGS